jgi:hypothetical protein
LEVYGTTDSILFLRKDQVLSKEERNINKMKLKKFLLPIVILIFCNIAVAAKRSVLVHNTYQDIEACKDKLKLRLVRIWGGDEEEDENKFFKSPSHVVMDKKGLVYICDSHRHHIKVFEHSGKYVRTIGERGRGPGDLYWPIFMAFYPDGDLVVSELGGYRIQRFNTTGKSKKIIKVGSIVSWLGVTSKNQLLVYDHDKTFHSRRLVSLWNERGKSIKEVGVYHDKARSYSASDKLFFAMDSEDNIYAMNRKVPVIRKYAPEGTMALAITFEPPFELPVKISLNDQGDEIRRVEEENYMEEFRENRRGNSITIQRRGRGRVNVSLYMDIDPEKRVYIVTLKRIRTLDEIKKGPSVIASKNFIKVIKGDYPLDREINHLRILVFNPKGKAIAEASLTTYCDGIYINGNRMFVIDGYINQRILEYEIQIED